MRNPIPENPNFADMKVSLAYYQNNPKLGNERKSSFSTKANLIFGEN